MPTDPDKKLLRGPVDLGGAIGRMVELPHGGGQIKTWGGGGWDAGGADVVSVMMAPHASPTVLRKHGVPKVYWHPILLEQDRLAEEPIQG